LFVRLSYSKGTVILEGGMSTPYGQWDQRIKAYRAPAYCHRDMRARATFRGAAYHSRTTFWIRLRSLR